MTKHPITTPLSSASELNLISPRLAQPPNWEWVIMIGTFVKPTWPRPTCGRRSCDRCRSIPHLYLRNWKDYADEPTLWILANHPGSARSTRPWCPQTLEGTHVDARRRCLLPARANCECISSHTCILVLNHLNGTLLSSTLRFNSTLDGLHKHYTLISWPTLHRSKVLW